MVDTAGEVVLQREVLLLVGGIRVGPVVDEMDGLDSDLDEFLAAAEAGAHGRVADGAFDADAELGRHEDGVLFSMDAETPVVSGASGIFGRVGAPMAALFFLVAVRVTHRRAVIPGRDDVPVLHENSADLTTKAAGAFAHCEGDA